MFEKYYDAVGNLRREVKFIDGEPNIESNSTGSLITDYRYDSSYRVSKVKTPEGKIIHYYYDGYGRQSQRITPDAGLTSYFYDKNDNLIFSQDANQKAVDQFKYTFRNYDGLNRLTGIGEKIFEIDAPSDGSQYNSSTDAYYLTINVYDTIANSIVSNLFFTPSGYTSPLYTKGNLAATAYRTKTSDNWNYKYYKYDVRGRVIKMWNIIADFDTLTTEYIYNSQDQITFLYYQSGKADSKSYYYEYDYTGRLKNTSYYTGPPSDNPIDYTNLASYNYNKNSQVSNQNFNGNTLENTYTYNNRNWITLMESSNNIFNYENGYFKNGNVKTQTLSGNYNDSFANNVNLNFSYTYDKSNRLLQSEKGSSYKLINTYDKDGNILTLKRYGATANRIDSFNYVYNSGANRLNRVTGSISQYTYDANGNMISDNLNKNNYVRYDYRNLIIELLHHSYTTHDTLLITRYNYDEAGNRVRKLIYKHITHPFDPEPENPEEELDVSDTQYWTFVKEEIYSRDVSGREMAIYVNGGIDEYPIYGLDMIGKLKNDVPNYYFKDHLGSVRAIVNSSNQLVSAQDYDAWGYLLQSRIYASNESKFKFTEKERDAESSYDYFGARYYDSRIANWTSIDPLMEKHFDWSPYNYVLRSPLLLIDPDGEQIKFSSNKEARDNAVQMLKYSLPISFSDYVNYTTDESGNFFLDAKLLSQADNISGSEEYNRLLNIAESKEETEIFFQGSDVPISANITGENGLAYANVGDQGNGNILNGLTIVSGNIANNQKPNNYSTSGNNEIYILNTVTQKTQVATLAHELFHVYNYLNFANWVHRKQDAEERIIYKRIEDKASENYENHIK